MKTIILKNNHINKEQGRYLEQYLGFLGIKPQDISSFLNEPKEEDWESASLLTNIEKAAKVLIEECEKPNAHVFVQVDSDTDGYTSAAIILQYIRIRFPGIKTTWRLHNGKEHGVIPETVPEDATLVIIPDAGSNQFDEHKTLADGGKKVIVLDHHELSEGLDINNSAAIIVNNQTSKYFYNKSLSGAGVVLKFISFLDNKYYNSDKIWRQYMDLAAIGIIADAMNMCNLDNNYIAYHGLSLIHNKFIHTLAVKQSRGIKNAYSPTKMEIMFYIAPVINGVIRNGDTEDKESVFHALITPNGEDKMFEHEWRGVVKLENTYDRAVRLAANAKSRQDSNKKKAFEWICTKIRNEKIDENNIIIVALNDKESSKVGANITGLIAMELVKEFNKPVLVLRKTEFEGQEVFGGSGRNGQFFELPDLKSALKDAGVFYGEGHSNAFGAFLLPEQVDSITQYFNTHYSAATFEDTVFEVDYWFHSGEKIDSNMLYEFANAAHIYGNSIPAPKFAFDMLIKESDFSVMGENNNSLKIFKDGVSFIMFGAEEIISKLENITTLDNAAHVQIIGKPSINEWKGRKTVQITIDDIVIKSYEDEVNEAAQSDWTSLI